MLRVLFRCAIKVMGWELSHEILAIPQWQPQKPSRPIPSILKELGCIYLNLVFTIYYFMHFKI